MKRLLPLIVLALFCSLLLACGSKVNKENAAKIKTGMTVAEVEGILGKGTEEKSGAGSIGGLSGSGKVITWKDGEKEIMVTFANDKVVAVVDKGL